MSNLTPDAATQQEVQQLLRCVARLKRKWPSEPALRDLSPQMVDTLLYEAYTLTKARAMTPGFIGAVTIFVCSASVRAGFQFSFVAPLACFAWGAAFWHGLKKARRNTAYALTQTEDMRVLPTLIKATSEGWGRHTEVTSAIKRLLSQVTEEQAGLLGPKVQERLWRLAIAPVNFNVECDEALAYGALHAFVHIGDRDTLNRMQKFILHMTSYPAHRYINDAVQSSIPLMIARLQRQEVPTTLLRASHTPIAQPETLLRPAHSTTAEPAEQLLRAGTIPQDE